MALFIFSDEVRVFNLKRVNIIFLLIFSTIWLAQSTIGLAEATSIQVVALAPNAGGQNAFAFRRATDIAEWGFFLNQSVKTGDVNLMGGGYAKRLSLCGIYCIWDFYIQAGIGLSTAGPMVEFLWGTNWLWLVRLDFATQIYLTKDRVILWNYPFWLGLSLPL